MVAIPGVFLPATPTATPTDPMKGRICCCRQFQDRQLRNTCGKVQQVLTHSDLVHYLQQKSSASTRHLAFDGMNQVVFGNIPTITSVTYAEHMPGQSVSY